MLHLSYIFIIGDCSTTYQMGFQDPATTTMEGIFLFNLHLFFISTPLTFSINKLLFTVLRKWKKMEQKIYKYKWS